MSDAARRFSDADLGRIQEIQTVIDCECPNHIAEVLQSLVAFEAYSARCSSKNDADAQMHAKLHQLTQQARVIMEGAMADLLVYEKIELSA